jgi:hypothetical protein
MAESHVELTPLQFEHDAKGKHIAKACECFTNSMKLCNVNELEPKILDDLQFKIR